MMFNMTHSSTVLRGDKKTATGRDEKQTFGPLHNQNIQAFIFFFYIIIILAWHHIRENVKTSYASDNLWEVCWYYARELLDLSNILQAVNKQKLLIQKQ